MIPVILVPVVAGGDSQVSDRIDAVVHDLTELLGKARAHAAPDAAAPDVAHDGAPMLALDAGGAP